MNTVVEQNIIAILRDLSPREISEVANFAKFLASNREAQLTRSATKASEPSFAAVWDNDEDAIYDKI
jgi:hypothetical protein